MATTVQNIVDAALREIGALASGESPSTAESNDALVTLNQLLASFNAQAAPIYQITRSTVSLTGAASYSLATRPIKIKAATVVQTTTVNMPLHIATPAEWANYIDRALTADFGEILFYEDGYPLSKVFIAPRFAGALEIISDKAMKEGTIEVRETFSGLSAAASYTMGVGATLASERAIRIKAASIQAASSIARSPALVTAELWAKFPRRGVGGSFAEVLYYDGGFTTGTVWLAPKPPAGTLELYTYEKLAAFASLAAEISLPDGYERVLRTCLAVELAPDYGRPVDAALQGAAEDAKTSVFGLNAAILGAPQASASQEAPPTPPAIERKAA